METNLKNVVTMPHISADFAILILRMKNVRKQFKPGSDAYMHMDRLIQETLRRGY